MAKLLTVLCVLFVVCVIERAFIEGGTDASDDVDTTTETTTVGETASTDVPSQSGEYLKNDHNSTTTDCPSDDADMRTEQDDVVITEYEAAVRAARAAVEAAERALAAARAALHAAIYALEKARREKSGKDYSNTGGGKHHA